MDEAQDRVVVSLSSQVEVAASTASGHSRFWVLLAGQLTGSVPKEVLARRRAALFCLVAPGRGQHARAVLFWSDGESSCDDGPSPPRPPSATESCANKPLQPPVLVIRCVGELEAESLRYTHGLAVP